MGTTLKVILSVALLAGGLMGQSDANCPDCSALANKASQLEFAAIEAEKAADLAAAIDAKYRNEAASKAGSARREASNAWQAYYACAKKCTPAPGGGNTTPAVSNCPEAQKWLDMAAAERRMADQAHALAKTLGHSNEASEIETQAGHDDYVAHGYEVQAAAALQKCAEKAAQSGQTPATATQAASTASANSPAPNTTPANVQPVPAASAPPGAIQLPRNGSLTAGINLINRCQTAQEFSVETSGLPKGLVQAKGPFPVGPQSTRKFPLTYSSQGIAPGLYSGSILVTCLHCDQACVSTQGSQNKTIPIQFFVPSGQ
jgi:hypothetical protein